MAPGAPVSPTNNSALAGNWLLFGSIPPVVATFPAAVGTSSLVAEFDVVGTKVVASATIQAACTSQSLVGATFSAALKGTMASDGSFTVSTPSTSQLSILTIQGIAPTATGGSWSGSYTFNFTSTLGQGCTFSQSGPFTASSIADIDGTFTGTGSLYVGSVKTPVTLNLNLTQGGLLYSLLGGTPVESRLALDGSVQMQGISCFNKGTSAAGRPSLVDGSEINTSFTMDDGSTLQLAGNLVDQSVTELSVNTLIVSGGQCSGTYPVFPPLQLQR